MAAEVLPVDEADVLRLRLVVGLGQHVHGELDDVVHLAAAGHEEGLQVLAHLAELGDEVTLAHDGAGLVGGDLTGHVERLAALHLEAVGIPDGLGERGGIHGHRELGHGGPPLLVGVIRKGPTW